MGIDYKLERLKQDCDFGKNLFFSVFGSTFVIIFSFASLGILKDITTWKSVMSILLVLWFVLYISSFGFYYVNHFRLLRYCDGGYKNGKKKATEKQNRTVLSVN